MTPEEFWASSVVLPSGCREWQRAKHPRGYGLVWFNGRMWRAHRVAFFLATGIDPGDEMVLHSCDNPPCCEPGHLSLGDHQKNMDERQDRGRTARGERHRTRTAPESTPRGERLPQAKLTEAEVIDLRARFEAGERQAALARRFGLDRSTVHGIVHGKLWTHLLTEKGRG